jgi:hypothetical protein
MKVTRKLSRRSFLGRVAGGAVAGGGALVMLSRSGTAMATDRDPSDPASYNDSDSSDPAGGGHRGCTDRDSGPNSDSPGHGRGTGRSDSDSGPGSDRAGCGRR